MELDLQKMIWYFWFLIIFLSQISIQRYLYFIYREKKKSNEKLDIVIDGLKAIYEHTKK